MRLIEQEESNTHEQERYKVGEKYYAVYTRGWQCYAELISISKRGYHMYNERHGHFYTTRESLDKHN